MIYYKMLQISANAMTCYDQNQVLLMSAYSQMGPSLECC